MMKTMLPFLLLGLALAGCASRKSVMAKPLDSGVKAVYDAPFEKVKRAAYDALGELVFKVHEEKWDGRAENVWVIQGSQGLSTGSTGRYVRIAIEKTEKEQTVYVFVEAKAASRDTQSVDDAIAKDLQSKIEKRALAK